MSCAYCGTPLAATARFCGACGRPVAQAPEAPGKNVAFDSTLAANADLPALGFEGGTEAEVTVPVRDNKRADSHSETLFNTASPLAKPAEPPDPNDPYIGTVLKGRFEIKNKLGEGGFGAVYGGVQSGTGRRVAIKLLHPEMTQDRNVVARFRREGQVLCGLRDAHTITTYDFDTTDDGTLFIAMELLEGRSLHDVFHTEAPIDWARMVKFIMESCSSLAEAHAQGIIHRDLKPENIHLERRSGNPEFVKILDFGIAKVVHGDGFGKTDQPQLTATGQTLGTLEYMSPEQLMGKQLDGRSDIYGLGVVAYELMTGQLPFPDANGPAALIAAQLRKTPRPPSAVVGGIPPAVDALILRMLEKTRDKRFADVDALRVACSDILAQNQGGPSMPSVRAGSGSRHPHAPSTPPPGAVGPAPTGNPISPNTPYPANPPHAQSSPSLQFSPNQMGPDTRAEIAATRSKNRMFLIIAIAVLVVLGVVGAILASQS